MMKKIIFRVTGTGLLLLSSLSADEAKLTAEPYSFQFNRDDFVVVKDKDFKGKDMFLRKGTTVGVFFKLDGDAHIELPRTNEFNSWAPTGLEVAPQALLKDSKGKNMGDLVFFSSEYNYWNPSYCVSYFSFGHSPSPGEEWVQLKGGLSVYIWTDAKTVEKSDIEFKKDEKFSIPPFDLKISELAEENKPWRVDDLFKYELNLWIESASGPYRIKEIKFTDENGNEINSRGTGSSGNYIGGDSKASMSLYYLLRDAPEKVNVSVTYYSLKKIDMPLDMKFDLYPERKEEIQQNNDQK